MKKTRYQKINEMANKAGGYWGGRAVSQLRYLEELIRCGETRLDSLCGEATEWLYERYAHAGAVVRADVAELETMLEPARDAAKRIAVSCVGHAHIDMNWMWSYDETAILTIDTVRTMLWLMEQYPGFTFLQSQASVYQIIERYAPELLPEIRARIRAGQWEPVAVTWVEPDKNLPNGESLVRHMVYTRRYLKDLLELDDEDFRVEFEPDTFGHTAQVPEIMAVGGVRYLYHCRGEERRSLYRWEAPSGARVTVLREPTWYNETLRDDSFLYVPGYCAELGLDRLCHVYGVGDHGGGVTRADIERILDMAQWPCMPALGFGRLRDFFAYADTLELPVETGERNFIFDGCYTTQTRIKKANRAAETALFTAEALSTFSRLQSAGPDACPYATEPLREAWQNTLFNQFHDILPGSCVIETREYAMGLFQQTMAHAGARQSAASRALAAQVNTASLLPPDVMPGSRSEGGGAGFGVPEFRYTASAGITGGPGRLYTIFNPTQADWDGLVELAVWDWPLSPDRARVTDETGSELTVDLIDRTMPVYWSHSVFRALVSIKIPAFGYRTVLLSEKDAPPPVPTFTDPRVDRVTEYELENDHLKAVFDRTTMRLVSLVDKATGGELVAGGTGGGFDWIHEDDSAGMTAWRVGRYMDRRPVARNIKMTGFERGPLRTRLSFTAKEGHSTIETIVSLDKGARLLRYTVTCKWREWGEPGRPIPQLAYGLPLARPCARYLYDAPFAMLAREPMDYDVPAGSYACAARDAGGLMMTADSKYGFRCTPSAMSLTLIRSSYDPDSVPEVYDHRFSFGLGPVTRTDAAGLLEEALRFSRPPQPVAVPAQAGPLPLCGAFLTVEKGAFMVSAVKMDEDTGRDVILRLAELEGRAGEAVIRLFKKPTGAVYADVHECEIPGEAPALLDDTVTVALRPFAVTTVRLIME